MCSTGSTKSHATFLPYPAQGHINPLMQLAKLFHSRGFHITFVNSEFNHRRLIRSRGEDAVKGLPDFRFETIPDGLPPSDSDATQSIPELCDSIRRTCLVPFLELLSRLNSSPEFPPVTCIVSDGIMSCGAKAGQVIGVPCVQFWTSSPVSFWGYLQYKELIERGIVPFKDEQYLSDGTLEMSIDIPGMPNIRLKDIPSFIRTTDPNDIMLNFVMEESQECLRSPIIFNTFDELDKQVLQVLADKSTNIYTIGPLASLSRRINKPEIQHDWLNSSLWKEDTRCIEWLNTKEPNSVVYVNYGSITVMSNHHLKEFAWGLANSRYPFLWIVRPDVVMGESAVLPKEFMEETKGRGFITSWCPQQQVLSHPAVGFF
ncbi:hypothetical protein V6N13_076702 [Hibiscus sabdariffa]